MQVDQYHFEVPRLQKPGSNTFNQLQSKDQLKINSESTTYHTKTTAISLAWYFFPVRIFTPHCAFLVISALGCVWDENLLSPVTPIVCHLWDIFTGIFIVYLTITSPHSSQELYYTEQLKMKSFSFP